MFVLHLFLSPQERKLFALRKFLKSIVLRLACRFLRFPLSSALIKCVSFHFCFKKGDFIVTFTEFCLLYSFIVGGNDQKAIVFDFCFTNLHICRVTWRIESFFWSDLHFLISSGLDLILFYFDFWLEIILQSGK